MPGNARPKARVPTWRGSRMSDSTRTISVMPHSSIEREAEALLERPMQLRLDAGAECRSARRGGVVIGPAGPAAAAR